MGALKLPTAGIVYVDTMTVIYTVERMLPYMPLLQPLWLAAQAQSVEVVSGELTLMETLVGPLKSGDTVLEATYEQMLLGADTAPSHHTAHSAGSGPLAGDHQAAYPRCHPRGHG